ncbi:response regulator transcription factor [Pedobacter polaris]|uniref:Response regulator transcription factor n=1 Tax=Pedobacter polaris TaxID=2571273 RepID=A0A4U1CU90_9SPHI|nr:LytTR family DNA-binding domain-containing protein [Pedobacter polaris]TKC10685.1 response regulator transcription factor [Pedobacter polaris]
MISYKCIIVDDNEIERDALEMYLRKINRLEIKAICSNGIEASDILVNEHIDIVFSDIDMPELSGIGLLKSVKNPPVFIFITSFSEYAAEGFNLDALDFIVKPATFERLLKASNKAIEYLDLKKLAENNTDQTKHNEADGDDYFFIKETKGFTRLNYDEVIYIESMGDFSKIFTAESKHITLVNLKNLERQLPSFFVRVHKQYIINLNHIATVASTEILLKHKYVVPVSITNKQDLMEKITNKTISRHSK